MMPVFLRQLSYFLALLVMLSVPFAIAKADQAIGWVGDLPVPAEAMIETTSGLNFDSPSGRVIQFTFHTSLTEQALFDFYAMMMPTLGWQAIADSYKKGDELMTIKPATSHDTDGKKAFLVIVQPAN